MLRFEEAKQVILEAVRTPGEGPWTGMQKDFANVNGLVLMPESVGTLDVGIEVQALHFDMVLS